MKPQNNKQISKDAVVTTIMNVSHVVAVLGKPSKKKRQKKLNFFNFGGGVKFFQNLTFSKTCLKSVLSHSESF